MSQTTNREGVLRFWKRGQIIELNNVPPDRMLLDLLRGDLRVCDAKEGCAAGDCGACTVVIADTADGEHLDFRAINSCIRPAHAIYGMALWTAADLAQEGVLHPAQAAIVQRHGTQCGFCTPGVVMSLFSLYQRTGYPFSSTVGKINRWMHKNPSQPLALTTQRHGFNFLIGSILSKLVANIWRNFAGLLALFAPNVA